MKQKDIAHKAKITSSMMSQILTGKRRPSWPLSERLEKATGISAVDWIDGRVDREYLLENYCPASGKKPEKENANKREEERRQRERRQRERREEERRKRERRQRERRKKESAGS